MGVDLIRRSYTTTCRFLPGQFASTVLWFPKAPGAKCLPFPSVISSLDWATDPWSQPDSAVGEIWNTPRPFVMKKFIPGTGTGHYCGSESDFVGSALPSPTPVEYGPNGLPLCCPSPAQSVGGILIGGSATAGTIDPCVVTNGVTTVGGIQFAVITFGRGTIPFFLPRALVIQSIEAEFQTETGDLPIAFNVYFGPSPFTASVGPFPADDLTNDLIASTPGQDWFLTSAAVSHTLAPGTWWMTLGEGFATDDDDLTWVINSGPTSGYYLSTSEPVTGYYFCIHGHFTGAYNSSGGVEIGGAGTALVNPLTATGSGSVEIGGAGNALVNPLTATGSGSIEIGGAATALASILVTGSGSIEIGGAATALASILVTGSGSIEIGGAASANQVLTATGSGSVEIGGAATVPPRGTSIRGFADGHKFITGSGTFPVTLPTGIVAGDQLFLIFFSSTPNFSAVGFTASLTFTNADSGPKYIVVLLREATGSEGATVTADCTAFGDDTVWFVLDVENCSGIDTSAARNGGNISITSIICPSVTPSDGSARLLLSLYCIGNDAGAAKTITAPVGQSQTPTVSSVSDQSHNACIGYETISGGSATGTRTATASGAALPYGATLVCAT
jgi:hypothetical protein